MKLNRTKQSTCHLEIVVQAGKSLVISKMFETKMMESETGCIRIDDATLPAMRAVVAFCYNAEIEFSDDVNPEEVLEIAHKYGIEHLERSCEEALMESINTANLPKRLQLARKVGAKLLQARALECLHNNFSDAIVAVLDELS
jgi:hypothetical protein